MSMLEVALDPATVAQLSARPSTRLGALRAAARRPGVYRPARSPQPPDIVIESPTRGFETRISLAALPPGMTVHLDGTPTGATVEVPAGRHRITLGSRTDERQKCW